MKTLDLHGVRHEEVERLLENFILLNEPPLKVITGNSAYMQNALEVFCRKHKVTYERWANWGEYTILAGEWRQEMIKEMTQEKKTYLKFILWLNLALGFHNLYMYVNNDSLFNLAIGALNIGVWVFYRSKIK